MDGYHNSETFMSDLNTLIYGHQMKMAGLFANWDVVAKLLHEQITLCDSLAKSVKDSQSFSITGIKCSRSCGGNGQKEIF